MILYCVNAKVNWFFVIFLCTHQVMVFVWFVCNACSSMYKHMQVSMNSTYFYHDVLRLL